MKKTFSILLTLLVTLTVNAKTIYLNTGGSGLWNQDEAVFFVHSWDNSTNADAQMTLDKGDVFKADIADSHTSVIFLRMPKGSTNVIWEGNGKFWNKTNNLTIPSGMDTYTITVWGANNNPVCTGTWSKTGSSGDNGNQGNQGGGQADVADGWYLYGAFNDWKATNPFAVKTGGAANTLYIDMEFEAGKEHDFKIVNANNKTLTWYGNGGTMTQLHHNEWGFATDEENNCRLATTIKGIYEFAFNTQTRTLTVTYPVNPKQSVLYETAVPDKNGDVMLQAFYWAHEGSTATPYTEFGNVNWSNLNAESETLSQYFDLVWLAPSQETADYTGYLPMNYSKQGTYEDKEGHHGHSPWGSAQDLRSLIDNLHKGGSKVIADIVLNHTSAGHVDEYTGADKNWCSWTLNDFGQYGKYQIDWSWITAEDEMFANDKMENRIDRSVTGDCGNHDNALLTPDDKFESYKNGTFDWNYSEYNSLYSRDLAHGKKEVREMSRAYLNWLRDSIGYDGFRWDFMKGIHGSRLLDYLRSSAPCFSVAEVFDGDIDKQLGFLKDANYSTYVFDFPGKFTIYNEAIGAYNLTKLKGNTYTLIFGDNKKYAVSFIDNHDSFREGSNFTGTANKVDALKSPMALAYLLSMPGVPCVLYPYWYSYKDECVKLIKARKSAGINSQSEVVNDWAGDGGMGKNYYTALIKGDKGYIFLKLGYDCAPKDAPMEASPDGKTWKLAWAQDYNNECHAAVWFTGDDWTPYVPSSIDNSIPDMDAPVKIIRNGVIYIQRGNEIYSVQGLRIR